MDLQLIVAVNVMMVSAMFIGQSLIYRARDVHGWLVVNALVLVVGALALWFAPETAGTWVSIVFFPLVVAPAALSFLAYRSTQAGQLKAAAWFAWGAALLFPTTAKRLAAKLSAAATGSDEANAEALKALLPETPPEFKPVIAANLALVRRDWSEVLAIASNIGPDAGAAVTQTMKPLEIRALAETGRIDAMVQ